MVENAEFTLILSKYVKHYGSFEEALKHIEEFADDEYAVIRTRYKWACNIKLVSLWRIYSEMRLIHLHQK